MVLAPLTPFQPAGEAAGGVGPALWRSWWSLGAAELLERRIEQEYAVVTHAPDSVAGRPLPSDGVGSELVSSAERAMRDALHPSIFNHTMRVLHLARHLPAPHPAPDHVALAVAVLFHDSGTIRENDGEQRFEVEGADAAARFLEGWDWTPDCIRPVWEAIALHTSPGIAERFGPLARMVRTAVLIDLGRTAMPVASTPALDAQLAQYPRSEIERVLPDMVVAQALARGGDMKAPPFSWPGALVAEQLAEREHRASRSHLSVRPESE